MTRTEIIHFLKEHSLSPNKRLGQNFLCDENITNKIIQTAEIQQSDSVLEIGPGLGELTEKLISTGCRICSVEIDSGLFRFLSGRYNNAENFTLHHADFLKSASLGSFNKAVANLPYYCASEILFKISEEYDPDSICVMLQREMAERIIAKPGSAEYGAMSVMLQIKYQSSIAFNVPSSSFHPAPDVTSSILMMKRSNGIILTEKEYPLFALLVKAAFWGRRKTFVTSCASSPHAVFERPILLDALRHIGMNDNIRGESLSAAQFAECTRFILQQRNIHDPESN